jgi:hypothetical protein
MRLSKLFPQLLRCYNGFLQLLIQFPELLQDILRACLIHFECFFAECNIIQETVDEFLGVIFSELGSLFIFLHRYNSATVMTKSQNGMCGMALNKGVGTNANGSNSSAIAKVLALT